MNLRVPLRAVVVAAALVAASGALPAVAAGPTIVATPSSVHRGHAVRLHGVILTCPRGDQVTLLSRAFVHTHEFASVPAVFTHIRAHGVYSTHTTIPASLRPGRYAITGRCGGGNLGTSFTLRVLR